MDDLRGILRKSIDRSNLTQREFADALNERLNGDKVTHTTVNYWLKGKTIPSTDFLTLVLIRYHDWRFDLALALLAAKKPEVWGEGGGIWAICKDR